MIRVIKACLASVSLLILMGCEPAAGPVSSSSAPEVVVHKLHGQTMGTTYNISLVGSNSLNTTTLNNLIDERLLEINRSLSTYDPSSELSLINRGEKKPDNNGAIPLSDSLTDVLNISLDVYQKSQQRFDVTIGPLVNLWGFGPDEADDKRPSDSRVQAALATVGSDYMRFNPDQQTLILERALYIDLSAVAKGWAVDQLALLLEAQGIDHYLVEIGGELRTQGQKPGNVPWKIAVEKPAYSLSEREGQLIIEPGNMAVATSGDYRNYIEIDGARFSHTIDPSTGYPITHNLASVTVLHPSCAMADAWATALNVAGPEAGLALAESQQLAAYFIVREAEGFAVVQSTTFRQRFNNLLSNSNNL